MPLELHAELRRDVGKGASRRLRRSGEKVPGIIYGGGNEPVPLTLSYNELAKAMQVESFYSQILNLVVDGESEQALVRDLQRHPASSKVQHIDFLRIRADTTIEVSVPLHYLDEDKCVGVRMHGGVISHSLTEVEISCLPANLPEYIEVPMADLDIGDSVHLSDLSLPEGVQIVALMYGDEDRDITVASVQMPRAVEEEEEEDLEAAAEGEVAGEGEEAPEPGEDSDAGEESSDD